MAITLNKAIEILDLNIKEASKQMPSDTKAALDLFISLGKAVQSVRKGARWDFHALQPGEAPEEK